MAWAAHPSGRKARLPADWPRIRRLVMQRDQGICYLCGQPGADRVDHKRRGDDHSMENLGAVHDSNAPHCHRLKSAREGAAARTAIQAKGRRREESHPGFVR